MDKYYKTALALGGNIDNILQNFTTAVNYLTENEFIIDKMSSVYTTPPVNCEEGANDFFNCIVTGYWKKPPQDLLHLCQTIELLIGRPEKHSSNESRLIDIDVILFEDQIINTSKLCVPHPRAHERLFVLIPLNEVASTWIFPTLNSKTETLLKNLKIKEPGLFNRIHQSGQKQSN